MELWNIEIMVLNQKKHFDATQYSIIPTFHCSFIFYTEGHLPMDKTS